MAPKTGFRGITSAQRSIVEYWESQCRTGGLPYRNQIDPGALRAHLSDITIVEMDTAGDMVFRVVGSGLRSILGRDVQGKALSSLNDTVSDMFTLGLSAVMSRKHAVGGVIDREYDRHAWLRLPMLDEHGGARLVLCHDHLLKKSATDYDRTEISYTVPNIKSGLAA